MTPRTAAPLSRDAIVDAAIGLVEREGPAALTMRRLGSELGVEGMALYHHVDNREALVRAIGDRLLEPYDTPATLRAVERLLGVLTAAGLAPADALAAYRAVASFARGYALAEATGFTVDAANAEGRRRLRALDEDEFPILSGRIRELASLDADDAFERGLGALVAGLDGPA